MLLDHAQQLVAMEKELRVGLQFTDREVLERETAEYGVVKIGNDYLVSVGYGSVLYRKLDDSQDSPWIALAYDTANLRHLCEKDGKIYFIESADNEKEEPEGVPREFFIIKSVKDFNEFAEYFSNDSEGAANLPKELFRYEIQDSTDPDPVTIRIIGRFIISTYGKRIYFYDQATKHPRYKDVQRQIEDTRTAYNGDWLYVTDESLFRCRITEQGGLERIWKVDIKCGELVETLPDGGILLLCRGREDCRGENQCCLCIVSMEG